VADKQKYIHPQRYPIFVRRRHVFVHIYLDAGARLDTTAIGPGVFKFYASLNDRFENIFDIASAQLFRFEKNVATVNLFGQRIVFHVHYGCVEGVNQPFSVRDKNVLYIFRNIRNFHWNISTIHDVLKKSSDSGKH